MAMSVFSDAPLPPDRTYWLQDRGFSGKTGMKAKSFFHVRGNWINVTPSTRVRADQVDPEDERAWQRDIAKFRKRAPPRIQHILRETAVTRIPSMAQDGYYALVLCIGDKKKVLCSSPIVRVLSTSTDPGSIRGASLGTLPLEIGAKILGSTVNGVTQNVLDPVLQPISNAAQPYMPGGVTQSAAETAADKAYSRKEDEISRSNSDHVQTRGHGEFDLGNGPVPPYPITFHSAAEPLEGDDSIPAARLVKPPEQTIRRLHGHYLGWARVHERHSEEPPSAWYGVLLSVLTLDVEQLARVDMSDALKRAVTVRFLSQVSFPPNMKIDVRVLGFIRPDSPPPEHAAKSTGSEAEVGRENRDIAVATRVLNNPAWGPKARPRNATLVDRYGDVQMRGQQLLDLIPLSHLGLRKPTDSMREKQLSINGFYIKRDR